MDVSIAIVSYNTKDLLYKCLFSIFDKTRDLDFEVIVIDNSSSDGTVQMLNSLPFPIKAIANSSNLGFSKAINQAFKISLGKFFFILNPDTELINDAILELMNFMKAHPDSGVVGPRLMYPDGGLHSSSRRFLTLAVALMDVLQLSLYFPKNTFTRNYTYDYWEHDYIREVDWVTGAALMTKRDIYKKTGMLDEDFFMYCEDMDYCLSSKKLGFNTFFNPKALVCHHHAKGGSQYSNVRSVEYYKSMYLYIKKHSGKPKAFTFRIFVYCWAIVYLIVRLIKFPFTRNRSSIIQYLRVPLKLLRWQGYGQ